MTTVKESAGQIVEAELKKIAKSVELISRLLPVLEDEGEVANECLHQNYESAATMGHMNRKRCLDCGAIFEG